MALQTNITTEAGLTANNAYLRVESVSLRSKTSMAFDLALYTNPAAGAPFERRDYWCGYSLTGENPIKQAYLYLKTLPKYADAQDV